MGKRGELSDREKKAFLKSITTSTTSPEDAKHVRGVIAVLVVFLISAALDGAFLWYLGLGAVNRGFGMLLVAEVAAMGGAYKLASGLRV
jgi:hypothetical protein